MTTTQPSWLIERQKSAIALHQSISVPKRGDEQWRFGNIKQIKAPAPVGPPLILSESEREDLSSRSTGLEDTAAKMIFLDDQLISASGNLPQGAICLPLSEALIQHPEKVEAHFMKQEAKLGSAKYAALHEASVSNGIFVSIPENLEIEESIEVHHWLSGSATAFPHSLIVTGKSSKVRVIEIFRSYDEVTPSFAIAYKDLYAGQNSSLDHILIQDLNEVSRFLSIQHTETSKDARSKSFILNTGAAWARAETMSRLEGAGSHSDMLSVSIPDHEQEYDQRTFQHHASPNTYSDLLYKNTLYGHSKTVFSGLIFVDEKAHHTDAYQTCRNLFMSDDCEANSMPGLEINADQVKCSHGSTSAQIADEEIFYLQARGIPADEARQLIARGYSIEAISRMEHEASEALLLHFVDKKFAQINS